MALIERGRCTFCIRSVRRDGRVTSEYVGSGAVAELAHGIAEGRRLEREAARAARREELAGLVARLDEVERPVRAYWEYTEALFRAAMERAGFHLHKRGEWRRRRRMSDDARGAGGPEAEWLWARGGHDPDFLRMLGLVGMAPEARGGDPAAAAERAVIRWAAGADRSAQARLRRKLEEFRAEVAGADPTALERVLARRVALCWLEVNAWDERLALCDLLTTEEGGVAFVEHKERRRNAAHRRFNQAVRTLAVVRQKALPAVKVSVEQRVPVAAPPRRGKASRRANRIEGDVPGAN
jgi:hypothetical protein